MQPCVGLILDDEVSSALKDVLLGAGYQVVIEPLTRFATPRAKTAPVEAWIFDARTEGLAVCREVEQCSLNKLEQALAKCGSGRVAGGWRCCCRGCCVC